MCSPQDHCEDEFGSHIQGTQRGFPGGLVVKNSSANAGDVGLISGLGRSPGGGNGNSLQYFCLGKIPWTEEPGGLYSPWSRRIGHNLVIKQQGSQQGLAMVGAQWMLGPSSSSSEWPRRTKHLRMREKRKWVSLMIFTWLFWGDDRC